jgi:hypothetical protein
MSQTVRTPTAFYSNQTAPFCARSKFFGPVFEAYSHQKIWQHISVDVDNTEDSLLDSSVEESSVDEPIIEESPIEDSSRMYFWIITKKILIRKSIDTRETFT